MASGSTVQSRSRRSGKKKASVQSGWKSFLPLLICLAVTPFTVRAASILALAGPKPFALLYPWVVVLRSPALHIPAELAGTLSQWMIFLQFPLYGVLMTIPCRAGKFQRALPTGVLAHFAGLFLVVLLAYLAQ